MGRGFFFAARTGSALGSPIALAAQHARSGQAAQSGAAGRQTVAPRSISAWLKSPGRSGGISSSALRAISARPAALSASPAKPVSREMTRVTLPSTAAARSPKAMDAMAPAV